MTVPARIRHLLTPAELEEDEALRKEELDRRWPKPEEGEIHTRIEQLKSEFGEVHQKMEATRSRLTLDAPIPAYLKRHLVTDINYHSRWSRNEVARVSAAQIRNAPQFTRMPVGTTDTARVRADNIERWLRARYSSVDRLQNSVYPLSHRVAYNQNEVGIGAIECYLTEAWGELLDEGFFDYDPEESTAQRKKRMQEMLARTGIPWAWRQVEPTSLYWEASEGPLTKAVIIEQKRYRDVYNSLRDKLSDDELNKRMRPLIGQIGHPLQNTATGDISVETRRYYDERWYGYEVAGAEMEIAEHGLPGVPIGICLGMPSGNPDKRWMFSGITDGMGEQEQYADWLKTLLLDRTFVYSVPRPVLEADEGAMPLDDEEAPEGFLRLSASDVTEVRVLPPGYKVRDAYAGMRANMNDFLPVLQIIQQDFQKSGQNPISQGESPGADTAGYTVNALSQAATTLYEPNLDQYARMWGWWADFELAIIRDTFGEEAYVAAPGRGRTAKTMKWLGLGPDDIDPTHTEVRIDPLSDTNRLALRQTLAAAVDRRVITKDREREEGYGITDHEAEENGILLDAARAAMDEMLIAESIEAIKIQAQAESAQAPPPGMAGPPDMAGPPPAQQGAVPAPIDQPTMGGAAAAMSQAGAPATRAGQQNGRFPPNATSGGPF